MNKTYLIFRHEFLHTVRRVSFSIMTLIVPVFGLLGIGILKMVTTVVEPQVEEIATIGYVDEAGLFDDQPGQGLIHLVPLASREDATQALVRKDVTEYIIIPSDYTSSGTVQRYTVEGGLITPQVTVDMIKHFLSVNLLADKVPPDMVTLIVSPLNVEVTRLNEDGGIATEQSNIGGNIGNVIIPGVFSLLLGLALMFGATSLISGLGEEKESRLIEVLFSSVSVRQLLSAKVLALGTAGLLQVLVWLISAPLLLGLASSSFGGFMSGVEIPVNFLILGIIYFVLGYLLFAVLSIGVGAISSNAREGEQLSLFYTLGSFTPLWFSSLLFFFPDSSIWIVLTIFPVTAPVQTMLRLGVSDVPTWQIMTSIGVLGLSIIVGLFLSIKVFRMHMLMHGKRPSFAKIIHSLKDA
jgi:ABC-2 type transport system permease protein